MQATSSPFIIAIDTREVYPWMFRDIPGLKGQGKIVVRRKWMSLGKHCGDYSIAEMQLPSFPHWRLSVERKSIGDLYSTILSRRDNFLKELETLQAMDYAAIVVEANISTVLTHIPKYWKDKKYSVEKRLAMQKSVIGSIHAWQLRYPNIRWWFMPRKYCEVWVYRILNRFWEDRVVR